MLFRTRFPGLRRCAVAARPAAATLVPLLTGPPPVPLLILPLLAASLAASAPSIDTLRQQIHDADTALFSAAFDDCDPDKAAAMTTEDMEFFHDKDGKSASRREDFRRSVANLCDSARAGGWHLRRELVEGSLQVFPLHDERALELGDHRFHERGADGVERWTGQARFIQIWRRVDGRWLAERVISYDHHPADR